MRQVVQAASAVPQAAEVSLGAAQQRSGIVVRKTHETGGTIDGQPEAMMQEHDVGLIIG
ncbi:hypothetical protein QNO09_38885 [Streptomyces sp. 378]|uniref:hypothetical protein n=1 Tax=Streptomyces sp. 378 TaxID=3049412 RepID=UPI0024C30F5A|nr:hypothetical protein [Streptomyces sp. 378]MDK1349110.1 hypothetical protein [Streptomyces sp. 378]